MRLTAGRALELASILVLALALPGCGGAVATPAAPTKPAEMSTSNGGSQAGRQEELVYGLTLVVSGIDPHIHASSELGIPLNSVYDTLVYLTGQQVRPRPGRVLDDLDDGLSYTFKLRKDVKFHDGTPFNAQAVKDNLDRIVDPATKSGKAAAPARARTRAPRWWTSSPQGSASTSRTWRCLDALAQVYLGMASPTAFKKWGPADYQLHQVGTGPFMFNDKEYVPKDTIVLDRNPDYNWGAVGLQAPGPGLPRPDRLQVLPGPAHPVAGAGDECGAGDRRAAAAGRGAPAEGCEVSRWWWPMRPACRCCSS